MNQFALWLARGFGLGLAPKAPGTFGSLGGLVWFLVLLLPGHFGWYVLGALAVTALSVWACGQAEIVLGRTDPGEVVLDEIIALPWCFLPAVGLYHLRHGVLPEAAVFFGSQGWLTVAVVFAGFRFFDIVKPWPIRQSQRLPGGWGVTVDDLLAAAGTGLLYFVVAILLPGKLVGA